MWLLYVLLGAIVLLLLVIAGFLGRIMEVTHNLSPFHVRGTLAAESAAQTLFATLQKLRGRDASDY